MSNRLCLVCIFSHAHLGLITIGLPIHATLPTEAHEAVSISHTKSAKLILKVLQKVQRREEGDSKGERYSKGYHQEKTRFRLYPNPQFALFALFSRYRLSPISSRLSETYPSSSHLRSSTSDPFRSSLLHRGFVIADQTGHLRSWI